MKTELESHLQTQHLHLFLTTSFLRQAESQIVAQEVFHIGVGMFTEKIQKILKCFFVFFVRICNNYGCMILFEAIYLMMKAFFGTGNTQ